VNFNFTKNKRRDGYVLRIEVLLELFAITKPFDYAQDSKAKATTESLTFLPYREQSR
jgi:hypothetical protein